MSRSGKTPEQPRERKPKEQGEMSPKARKLVEEALKRFNRRAGHKD